MEYITGNVKFTEDMIQKFIDFYKLIRKYRFLNDWDIDKIVSGFCIKNQISEKIIHDVFRGIYGNEHNEKVTNYVIKLVKEKHKDLLPGIAVVIGQANEILNSGKLNNEEKALVIDFITYIKQNRDNKDDIELPYNLTGVVDVYLISSVEKYSKNRGIYYSEKYFVERNINGTKYVWYVKLNSNEQYAIYKKHVFLFDQDEIGIKIDITRLLKGLKDGTITYEILVNDDSTFIPSYDSSKLKSIIKEIPAEYLCFFNMPFYQEYFNIKLKEFYDKHSGEPQPCIISRSTGWDDNFKMFFHYDLNDENHVLSKDNLLYQRHKAESFNQKEQHELVYKLLLEGKLLGTLLAISASSILLKPLNLQPIICVISGDYGLGKTTSSLIATSLFYKSDGVLIDIDTLNIGFDQIFSYLNSLPIVIDEDRLTSFVIYSGGLGFLSTSLEHTIFSTSSRKSKAYDKNYLIVDITNLNSNILWTTELTNVDEIRKAGASDKMLIVTVKDWYDFTRSSDLSMEYYSLYERFSGCGVDYIKFVMENLEKLKDRFRKEIMLLSDKYKGISDIARTLYSGIILFEEFYTQYFNLSQPLILKELRQKADTLLSDAKKMFISSLKNEIVLEFYRYLYCNIESFGRFENLGGRLKYAVVHRPNQRKMLGEYDITTKTFYITTKGFKTIAEKLREDEKSLINSLVETGVMEEDPISYYSKITKTMVKVYKIKFGR